MAAERNKWRGHLGHEFGYGIRQPGYCVAKRRIPFSRKRISFSQCKLRHVNADGLAYERWQSGMAFTERGHHSFDSHPGDHSRCPASHLRDAKRVSGAEPSVRGFTVEVPLS